MKVQNLSEFVELMKKTVNTRKTLVNRYFFYKTVDSIHLQKLKSTLETLKQIPNQNGFKLLYIDDERTIITNMDYEIGELKKDICFFESGEQELTKVFEQDYENYNQQVKEGVDFLSDIVFRNFITDRDGTVNNYCGRYSTSVQSAYNSIYLSRYAANFVRNAIILTSAPLITNGLKEISVNPENIFNYAGSKGREYLDKNGNTGHLAIEPEKQQMLDKLNNALEDLTKKPYYHNFTLIGSGLQLKFGQTTIARQDINESIEKGKSESFLKEVKKLVDQIDPEKKYFRIEDTGLDIEIILTIEDQDNNSIKDFDKGDGINFLNDSLKLNLHKGPNLICGDTNSDIPMVRDAMEHSENTCTIFVTEDKNLKDKVVSECPNSFFVDKPDILISILNNKSLK